MTYVDTWSADRRTVTSTCRSCPPGDPRGENRFRASDPITRARWKRQHDADRHPARPTPQGDDAA